MLEVTNEGYVRTITINHPEAMNALSPMNIKELNTLLEQAASDNTVRVLIITGAGKIFCAGIEVESLANPHNERYAEMWQHDLCQLFESFIDFPKPLMMAVNGMGVGLGATICGFADMMIMAESAKLKCPFAAYGLVPEACSTHYFTRSMGHQWAMWLLLSNEWMTAQQCKEAGLALEVVPNEQLMSEAMGRAQTLAAFPTASLITSKALMVDPQRDELKRVNRAELTAFRNALDGPACKEGLAAFHQRRPADFSGF